MEQLKNRREDEDRERRTPDRTPETSWERPAIEWEEDYEPVVFAVSCTSQPFNCGGGARF